MPTSREKLNVAFLWHQHQPYYRISTPEGSYYHMPWVRFHAVKDYYDIPLLLQEFPSIRQNFNLVPSMLIQIEDFVRHRAQDHVLRLTMKEPSRLEEDEKKSILRLFFVAHFDHMIRPYPRYLELWEKRKSPDWSPQDWLDLQVWYNLCWVGESWKEKEPVASLLNKGRFFTEADKKALIDCHYDIMAQVIPLYKSLMESGRVELSVTPFYHPILPLLCDSDIHRISNPNRAPVDFRFRHPEDADAQIAKAVEYFTNLFGGAPRGMWPSEGSVSTEAAELMRRHGIEWAATDEEILHHSETAGDNRSILNPHAVQTDGGTLALVFRDHSLSDAIGFTYAKWKAQDAVRDFVRRIEDIRTGIVRKNGNPADHLLNIILDGENCWEFYEHNGADFLRQLYAALESSATIRTTTISDFLETLRATKKSPPAITRLHPGSWINHNFDIWIGKHAEKNLGWKYLGEARDFLQTRDPDRKQKDAWETLYIAEGSDWFWWFGDDHQAENKQDFDELFRYNLRRIYQLLDAPVPPHLLQPIMSVATADLFTQPTAWVDARVDGIVSHYYEWQDAGVYLSRSDSDAMHMAGQWIDSLRYGFNESTFFLRVDFDPDQLETLRTNPLAAVGVDFYHGEDLRFTVRKSLAGGYDGTVRTAFQDIFEMSIPLEVLHIRPTDRIEWTVTLWLGDREVIRRPSRSRLTIERSDLFFDKYIWSV